jgi:hypothetical protein
MGCGKAGALVNPKINIDNKGFFATNGHISLVVKC